MKSYCWKEGKTCVKWVRKYFKDCLCNMNDDLSFSFGILSLLSWGVAEIPQIFTNFQAKSSHGVSLLFLLGWVLGYFFLFFFYFSFSFFFSFQKIIEISYKIIIL